MPVQMPLPLPYVFKFSKSTFLKGQNMKSQKIHPRCPRKFDFYIPVSNFPGLLPNCRCWKELLVLLTLKS